MTQYTTVCPEDQTVFRPPLKDNLFGRHTPSMRKLTCPICGKKSYCLEVYAPDSRPIKIGNYLVWNEDGDRR